MTLRIKYEMLTAKGKLRLLKDKDGKKEDVQTDAEAAEEAEKLKKKLKLDHVRIVRTATSTFDV